jgi:ABC-type polysaccharide/polyol phosphate transport system ATPase subunit
MPEFKVPSLTGEIAVSAEFGKSLVLLGANGSGKTRLGAEIETVLGQHNNVHRIGAHRSLILNTAVQPPSFEMAERAFLYGYAQGGHGQRIAHRGVTSLQLI